MSAHEKVFRIVVGGFAIVMAFVSGYLTLIFVIGDPGKSGDWHVIVPVAGVFCGFVGYILLKGVEV